jgi:LuxR family quorum-sensing system transcriptional regulator CciR
MGKLAEVQAFIDLSRKAKTGDDLTLLMEQITLDMGFDYFAVKYHIDIHSAVPCGLLLSGNCPPDVCEMMGTSPDEIGNAIYLASAVTHVGFAWSDIPLMVRLPAEQEDGFKLFCGEGLADGFTVPAHIPGEGTDCCTFALPSNATIPREMLPMAQLVGSYALAAGRNIVKRSASERKRPKLTSRQIECVTMIAHGKTDREIAQALGLKPATINEYVEDACRRYNVSRRIQLVINAVHDGHLTLAEALGTNTPPFLPG